MRVLIINLLKFIFEEQLLHQVFKLRSRFVVYLVQVVLARLQRRLIFEQVFVVVKLYICQLLQLAIYNHAVFVLDGPLMLK